MGSDGATPAESAAPHGVGATPASATDFALPAVLILAATVFNAKLLGDGDTLWHLAAGQWILAHAAVPFTDPFSYTFAGKDWHAHEWLAEVVFAIVHRLGGWSGVLLLTGGSVAAAIGVLCHSVRRHVGWPGAALASLLAYACVAPHMLARPHVLSLPLIAIWTRVLLDARAARRAPHFGWLALIVFWANIHGSVLFAVGLVAVFAFEALIEDVAGWRRTLRAWVPFGLGAAVAMLATPRGLEGAIFLVRLTQMESLKAIIEWMPADLTRPSGLAALIGAGLLVLLSRGVKVPPVRVLLLLVLLFMTFRHQRHEVLLALSGTMIACEAIGLASSAGGPRAWSAPPRLALAAGLVALVLAAVRLAMPAGLADSQRAMQNALARVPANVRKTNVFNSYGSGGYLISQGIPVFVDGRTDLYGDAFFARFEAIANDRNGALDKALADYDIGWSFIRSDSQAARSLDTKPGWRLLYSGDGISIHVRQEAPDRENGGRRKD